MRKVSVPTQAGLTTIRPAFTLIELLLALVLSGIVLMLLGAAIDMQWRLFDARRTGVEENLLARAVIRRISDDLRGAILYSPPDLEGLDALANSPAAQLASLTGAGGMAGIAGAVTGDPSTADGSSDSGSDPETTTSSSTAESTTEESSTEEEAALQPAIVGIYGSSDWISIDVSRLPRIDEYQSLMTPENGLTPTDIPSDVKTVTYYVAYDEFSDPADGTVPDSPVAEAGAPPVLRGLIRQQLSRAVTAWNELGSSTDVSTNAEILAEEVTAIEFAYFDGTQWYTDWSSQDMGGLPVAVAMAIQVEMRASRMAQQTAALAGEDPDSSMNVSIHRMVVHLPAARKLIPVDESLTEETTDSSASEPAPEDAP